MKKLDNRGWGMLIFLIIIFLLFCTLLLIAYLVNQYGALPSSSRSNTSYHYVDFIAK